jgi:primosomal protein N' (replication factor Y)
VDTIDLREEYQPGKPFAALSRLLVNGMRATLEGGGQVMLLLNRRGFATSILCPQCGETAVCQHCDVALVYHRDFERLLCHTCDTEYPIPERCPRCSGPAIRYSGVGIQRVEEEVKRRFPQYVCERMDSDTMRSAKQYERVLTAFRQGSVHILLGTQMIAKGLDFPNVRLVGVVSADTARSLPDFRASERTFQLIAQVAGRTGRGDDPGRVLVQTYSPTDPAILAAAQHDYARFANTELPIRREYGYPPFRRLTRVIVRAPSLEVAQQASKLLADRVKAAIRPGQDVKVLGPAPAPISRLKDHFRMHLQFTTVEEQTRRLLLEQAFDDVKLPPETEWAVDVDPLHQL